MSRTGFNGSFLIKNALLFDDSSIQIRRKIATSKGDKSSASDLILVTLVLLLT